MKKISESKKLKKVLILALTFIALFAVAIVPALAENTGDREPERDVQVARRTALGINAFNMPYYSPPSGDYSPWVSSSDWHFDLWGTDNLYLWFSLGYPRSGVTVASVSHMLTPLIRDTDFSITYSADAYTGEYTGGTITIYRSWIMTTSPVHGDTIEFRVNFTTNYTAFSSVLIVNSENPPANPNNYTVLVSPMGSDDIGYVLPRTAIGNRFVQMERYQMRWLSEASFLAQFDTVFLNCGSSVQNSTAIRNFVRNGGRLYASDLMGSFVNEAFRSNNPFMFEHLPAQELTANVRPILRPNLGNRSTIQVNFDMTAAAITNWREFSSDDVTTYLYDANTGYALVVSFRYHGGLVVFTSFHVSHGAVPTQGTIDALNEIVFLLDRFVGQDDDQVRSVADDLGLQSTASTLRLNNGKATLSHSTGAGDDFAVIVPQEHNAEIIVVAPNGNRFSNFDENGNVIPTGEPARVVSVPVASNSNDDIHRETMAVSSFGYHSGNPLALGMSARTGLAQLSVNYNVSNMNNNGISGSMTITSLGYHGLHVENAISGNWSIEILADAGLTSITVNLATGQTSTEQPPPSPSPSPPPNWNNDWYATAPYVAAVAAPVAHDVPQTGISGRMILPLALGLLGFALVAGTIGHRIYRCKKDKA